MAQFRFQPDGTAQLFSFVNLGHPVHLKLGHLDQLEAPPPINEILFLQIKPLPFIIFFIHTH